MRQELRGIAFFTLCGALGGCYSGVTAVAGDPDEDSDGGTGEASGVGSDTDSASPADCDPRQYFDSYLWPDVIEGRCIACHVEGGQATATRFVLSDDASENYLATTWAADELVSAENNRSLLELKPTGVVTHGGGIRFSEGTASHQRVVEFLTHLKGDACEPVDPPPELGPFYADVTFIAPLRLLRRLTLALGGRLPTDAEFQAVEAGGMDAVETVLDALLDEQGFYDRVKEAFGDILLTEGYSLNSEPEYVLAYGLFPSRGWYQADTDLYRDDYTRGIRYEPVEFIQYVLENDLPFHEIVTGDYMVVSPYSARGYNLAGGFDMLATVEPLFADPTDPTEFVKARLPAIVGANSQVQESETGFYPHAGLLSTFHYTYVYGSTDSNRNRHRARMFYKHFLGEDIMALAPSVTDAAAVTAQYDNPTMEAPECVACHQTLDPVAGLFQQYDNDGVPNIPAAPWYDDMFAPGFEQDVLPVTDTWRSLQWLGERVADDSRFPVAMAEHAWYVLTQENVTTRPIDMEDPLFAARMRAYTEQRNAIQDAADAMVAANFDFKQAVRSLVLSNQYLAVGFEGDTSDPQRMAELELLGVDALLTPEQLDRKFELLIGFDIGGQRALAGSSDILYGGLDFRTVVERIKLPNAVMGAKMRKWAGDAACKRVPEELKVGPGARPMFPEVDATTSGETAIRANIVHLHWMLLGLAVTPESPDVERTYQLFEAVRSGGLERIAGGDEDTQVVYSCRPSDGDRDDPDYIIRSWQAVVTYLLRRPEFLSQ